MKRYAILLACAMAAALPALAAAEGTAGAAAGSPDAATILSRLDANASFKAIRYSGRMEIVTGSESRVKTMEAVASGRDKAFVEFTNPEDRGTRYLKLGSDLWMYFPKEADTVKISGHLLKEGMMGSDVSYEDALESKDFSSRYRASVRGREGLDGRDCWVIELNATSPQVPYERLVIWVDAERWVSLKEEMYAKSGKLLKTSRSLEVRQVQGRWLAVKSELVSALRKDSRTVFSLDKVEVDPDLKPSQFTMGELTR
jgi:outer membrane lipoprotein-sorting protein